MKPRRSHYLSNVLNLMGAPYVYGGRSAEGLDCWGLVALALRQAGGPNLYRWWTDHAWAQLPAVEGREALPGDLAFYARAGAEPGDVEHVVVLAGHGTVVSASYGSSRITTPELAAAASPPARVMAWPTVHYRAGFVGFRSLSPYLT